MLMINVRGAPLSPVLVPTVRPRRWLSVMLSCGGARARYGREISPYASFAPSSSWPRPVRVYRRTILIAPFPDERHTALSLASIILSVTSPYATDQGLYFENRPGLAAIILSLATNLIATSLIAFKAWYALPRPRSWR